MFDADARARLGKGIVMAWLVNQVIKCD
jgi:hypothetical protein